MAKKPLMQRILEELGYEVYWWREPPSEPSRVEKRFSDILPPLALHPIGGSKLYKHQYEAFKALIEDKNLILTARTGSGKTEAWVLPALYKKWRVLAVYPTLALSADQIKRLEEYSKLAGSGEVVRIDRPSIARSKRAREKIASRLSKAEIVVTNPAFLLAELKRMASSSEKSILARFLEEVDLIVVDELDFYGPRSAHLILKAVELISTIISAKKPRIVVLSATLGNPGELAELLTSINGRDSVIVEGKPFHVENYVLVVLGKNVEALQNFINRNRSLIEASNAEWILEVVDEPDLLREHLYEVYNALEAIGLNPPRLGLSVEEMLATLVEEEKEHRVTLVFAKSIRQADRIYRELLAWLPPEQAKLVALHHHLVPKDRREEIEKKARLGLVKVIITVRTLAQGIDIGTISRVVHVGLPLDLREYLQREGRKGRRKELGYTETVIIPSGLWDRKLLESGASSLKKWLSLPLEKLYITPSHKYALVFSGLWKLFRGLKLEKSEEEVLISLGLVERGIDAFGRKKLYVNDKGKRFWSDIGFYEHGPPYGYRKVLVRNSDNVFLKEEVSHRDAIEKYQPGSYDSMTESLVVSLDYRTKRLYLQSVREAVERHEWLAAALARYEEIKRFWGEKPDLENDMKYGRLYTSVSINAIAPVEGFGELVEEPLDVAWIIESRRPRLSRRGEVRVYREVEVVYLGAPVSGRYRDYTYGYVFEAPGKLSASDTRLALATLLAFLRVDDKYSLPLWLLRYQVSSTGGIRVIHLWESDAAGVLESIDWHDVSLSLEKTRPHSLVAVLIAAIDPLAALRIMRGEVSLEDAYKNAALVARSISGHKLIRSGAIEIVVPRHSPEHKIASIALIHVDVGEDQYIALSYYTGAGRPSVAHLKGTKGLTLAFDASRKLLEVVDKLLAEGYRIYYYGEEQRSLLVRLASSSPILLYSLRDLEATQKLVDLASIVESRYGPLPILSLLRPKLKDYREWVARLIRSKKLGELEKALKALATETALAIYEAALAATHNKIKVLEEKAS